MKSHMCSKAEGTVSQILTTQQQNADAGSNVKHHRSEFQWHESHRTQRSSNSLQETHAFHCILV